MNDLWALRQEFHGSCLYGLLLTPWYAICQINDRIFLYVQVEVSDGVSGRVV